MTLYNTIKAEIAAGRLRNPWNTRDLLANAALRRYSPNYLTTQPANRSISVPGRDLDIGADVRRAGFRYVRVDREDGALLYMLYGATDDRAAVDAKYGKPVFAPSVDDDAEAETIEEHDHAPDGAADAVRFALTDAAFPVLGELVKRMHDEQPWDDRLADYRWKGRTFEETQDDLAALIEQGRRLARALAGNLAWQADDQEHVVAWASDIFKWGGTRQRDTVTWQKVRATLTNALRNDIVEPRAPMNSGYTKVASLGTAYLDVQGADGVAQVINDSRVATSLTCRLEQVLRERGLAPKDVFPGLGKVEVGRGGTRPRPLGLAWPNAYQKWSGQFAATAVVAAIRDILNRHPGYPGMPVRGGETPWTVRGVEAVLFMDGY